MLKNIHHFYVKLSFLFLLFQAFQDSGYGGRTKRPSSSAATDKENFSPTLNTTLNTSGSVAGGSGSKARKSLAHNWAPREDSFSAPETPSKSLVGTSDASMLFSPPGILKETLPEDDSGMDSMSHSHNNQNQHRMSSLSK